MKRIALLLTLALAMPLFGGALDERQKAEHVLNRLGFGARPGDVDRIAAMGVNRWIAQQLAPERIADAPLEAKLDKYETLDMSSDELVGTIYRPLREMRRKKDKDGEEEKADPAQLRELRQQGRRVIEELTAQRILRAAESERQLNEVMVDFWMNHFNVFAGKGIDRFLLTSYERDTIRPNIWGRFEDLLMATAKSPAMLFYLDNARSRRDGLNENYARELMELHTIGVDAGYSQKDVTELARLLTGWSIVQPRRGSGFVFRKFMHDKEPKTILGVKFPAGGGIEEGEKMIRILANHPATAQHIARKLAQRLVSDEPPQALIDRVARRFLDTRGDLRETVRAVVTSPEFWDAKYYRAKTKAPFEYSVSAIRAVGGKINDARPLARELQKMGQPLYFAQPPTGYSDAAEVWMNSGALINRLNFATSLAANKVPGIVVTKTDEKTAVHLGSPEFQKQ